VSAGGRGDGGPHFSSTIALIGSITVAIVGALLGLVVIFSPAFRPHTGPQPTATAELPAPTRTVTVAASPGQHSPSATPQPVMVVPSVITIDVNSGGDTGLLAWGPLLGAVAGVITALGSVAAVFFSRDRRRQAAQETPPASVSGP